MQTMLTVPTQTSVLYCATDYRALVVTLAIAARTDAIAPREPPLMRSGTTSSQPCAASHTVI